MVGPCMTKRRYVRAICQNCWEDSCQCFGQGVQPPSDLVDTSGPALLTPPFGASLETFRSTPLSRAEGWSSLNWIRQVQDDNIKSTIVVFWLFFGVIVYEDYPGRRGLSGSEVPEDFHQITINVYHYCFLYSWMAQNLAQGRSFTSAPDKASGRVDSIAGCTNDCVDVPPSLQN